LLPNANNLGTRTAGTTRNLKYLQNYTQALPSKSKTNNKNSFVTTKNDQENSLARFIKARELAEERSNERIAKLKKML